MPSPRSTFTPRIAVVGLWHLGAVTAACLAGSEWPVLGVDPDPNVVGNLLQDTPPLFEPGLEELIAQQRAAGVLDFAGPNSDALRSAEIVWICFDTPVDDDDVADVDFVVDHAAAALAGAGPSALVVVSSQLPVGSVARLEREMADRGRADLRFACVPENLRLGKAIETFRSPDRFVAGVRDDADRELLGAALARFSDRVEWMSVESAEMVKHSLNAFLATSVAFINEVAAICEKVGADGADVARGLKSDRRIGPRAYLSPGDAFAGGTLARDINFLEVLAEREGLPAGLVAGVAVSNREHRNWSRRTLQSLFEGPDRAGVANRQIALWGLTYKPGTDTLRRSSAIALIDWLVKAGAQVRAYDPAISELPAEHQAQLAGNPIAAVEGADALVVCTPWPEFREVPVARVLEAMSQPNVIDAGGQLSEALGADPSVRYLRVGVRPS